MTRHVQLNNIDHRDLRIDTARGTALGDGVSFAPVVPAEFRSVQACYPIVFRKAADGGFQPVALFGFEEGMNLFLDDDQWDAPYLPLAIERQPFLIGRGGDALTVHIDLDHPRVRTDVGEALFREHGGTTDFLERMTSLLLSLHEGLERVPALVDVLLRHELLESFVLDVRLDDGSECRFAGFYTIAEERLRALNGTALVDLHRGGHLEAAYMAMASLSRFRDLVDRLSRRRAAGR